MDLFCLILFLAAASLWFFTTEYDTLFGVYEPTCVVRRRIFLSIVFIVLLASVGFSGSGDVEASVYMHLGLFSIDCRSMLVMMLSSFIVLAALRFFSVRGSVCYALLGALGACWIIGGVGRGPDWRFVLSFFAAPVVAFGLSALVRFLMRMFFGRVSVHLVSLSCYMRHAVIVCIILTAAALGLNWGGMLCGIGEMMMSGRVVGTTALAVTGAAMLTVLYIRKDGSPEPSGMFADFSIYAVVSVGFSVAVTLLFFSFETTASSVGLCPVPLSVSSLVLSAVAGAEVAQRSRLVEDDEYVKEALAMVIAPSASFILAYLLLYITGAEEDMMDFVVMASAVAVLMALAFAGYVRMQKRLKDATDRLVYTQQQQIYEHSRALNDMELKVVLSENQALHNAVEQKRQEVMNVALSIVEQKEFLESLDAMVRRLAKSDDPKEKDRLIAELGSSLRQRLSYDRDVDSQYFYAQAESLHEDFNAKLSENFPNMTQQEKRLATLLRLGFSSKYIATLMNITPKSVEISRYRLRQKLGLSKGDNLVNFIKSI